MVKCHCNFSQSLCIQVKYCWAYYSVSQTFNFEQFQCSSFCCHLINLGNWCQLYLIHHSVAITFAVRPCFVISFEDSDHRCVSKLESCFMFDSIIFCLVTGESYLHLKEHGCCSFKVIVAELKDNFTSLKEKLTFII